MKPIKIIVIQIAFLVIVLCIIYILYPKVNVSVDKDLVKFNSINAKVVMISKNPDFLNPSYLDFNEVKNISFNLEPGTYYWKSDNGIIESLKKEFTIESEVGMKIEQDNETELKNIGNVRLNISKNEKGTMVGHIILEPDENEIIEDKGEYVGRQEE